MKAKTLIYAIRDLWIYSSIENLDKSQIERIDEICQLPEIVNIACIEDYEKKNIKELQKFLDKFAKRIESEY